MKDVQFCEGTPSIVAAEEDYNIFVVVVESLLYQNYSNDCTGNLDSI